MGKSARQLTLRPKAEWDSRGASRQRIYEAERRIAEPTPTPIYPHLSVIRFPKIKSCPGAYDWHEALDDLGMRNRSVGTARSLGSCAISLLTGGQMNDMLRKAYPEDAAKINSMARLQRHVGEGITAFLAREYLANAGTAVEATSDQYYAERAQIEDFDNDRMVWEELDAADICLSSFDQQHMVEHKFGQSTFPVPKKDALQLFGRGYGIDLSAVDQLYQEMDDLTRFLRKDYLLDTSLIDPQRKPHASVFDFHDHIKYAGIYHEVAMPTEITYSAPVVLNS